MGQFLAIGLVNEMMVAKENIEIAGITVEQLQSELDKQLYFSPDIYTASESNDCYVFTLNNEVLHSQLIPFLEALYPKLYSDDNYYKPVLEALNKKPAATWLEWADGKPQEAFQADDYCTPSYIFAGSESIKVMFEAIILSMEGKILMETYGRLFKFTKYCMLQTFSEFKIASALQIYITG